eukprot:gnl/TRDRNA2_/TRDRNA2_75868_c1_seq1.p1 gnl/TRDRNA2_/TRDRNA2_75868_c1~~gnl/TRDRNA2_/TRDRNA2_75868_c1_seq1.p1  ORF type:complete len:126 (-),score=14.67 gnl/TRDRNA2_/TRDRNA2_75868_c1_seq1:4-348(-)
MAVPGACGHAMRRCPDLFAGRLIAAHAEGLCVHCLGPGAAGGNQWLELGGANASSDWSQFDCACLRSGAAGESDAFAIRHKQAMDTELTIADLSASSHVVVVSQQDDANKPIIT